MKLQEMKAVIDTGEIVVDKDDDGYVAARLLDGKYYSIEGFERKAHESFEALCEYLDPDADAFTSEECHWEISAPPTPRMIASAVLWLPQLKTELLALLPEQETKAYE